MKTTKTHTKTEKISSHTDCKSNSYNKNNTMKEPKLTVKENILMSLSLITGFAISIYVASITFEPVAYVGAIITIVVVNKLFSNK